MKDKNLRSFQKALITGASSGIGEALAVELSEKGVSLILAGRDRGRLESLASRLQERVSVEIAVVDLTKSEERSRLVNRIRESAPDLVINNAGSGLYGEALSYETADHLATVELNVSALLELTLEAARTLVSRGQTGVIMNISSVAATPVFPFFSVYSATKAFVNQLSESLDFELRGRGIRVLAACPGRVATRFQQRAARTEEPHEPGESFMSTEFAAREILAQIDSGRRLRAFDWRYRLIEFLCRYVLPKSWVAASVSHSIKQLARKRPLILFPNHEKK